MSSIPCNQTQEWIECAGIERKPENPSFSSSRFLFWSSISTDLNDQLEIQIHASCYGREKVETVEFNRRIKERSRTKWRINRGKILNFAKILIKQLINKYLYVPGAWEKILILCFFLKGECSFSSVGDIRSWPAYGGIYWGTREEIIANKKRGVGCLGAFLTSESLLLMKVTVGTFERESLDLEHRLQASFNFLSPFSFFFLFINLL